MCLFWNDTKSCRICRTYGIYIRLKNPSVYLSVCLPFIMVMCNPQRSYIGIQFTHHSTKHISHASKKDYVISFLGPQTRSGVFVHFIFIARANTKFSVTIVNPI